MRPSDPAQGTDAEAAAGSPDPTEELPPALRSLWRTIKIGYRAEPRLLVVSFSMVIVTALPDVLVAVWLRMLTNGVLSHNRSRIITAAIGLAVSTAGTWFVRVVFDRLQRRFRDRVGIALESHVARLQASVPGIEHQERPALLDRLAVLRDQVFALDHLFMSLFSTLGWVLRLVFTVGLLATVHPALILLVVFAAPTVLVATWRPRLERETEERQAAHNRLARHLFLTGTTPSPGKDVRVSGLGPKLVTERRSSWEQYYGPVASVRWRSALWHTATWTLFGAAYVGAIVFVASGLDASTGEVLLVLVAGSRLSAYVGAAVGELGFLRGIWLDSSRRLTWLEDYADAVDRHADATVPERLVTGVRFENVSFRYPGTTKFVLEDVTLDLPAGAVVAVVGENGAGKSTLVKLLCRMYRPTDGRILIDGVDLSRMPTDKWRQRLAGAFQDFFRFEFHAMSSVGLGDEPRIDDRPVVESAVARAGADDVIDRLAYGLDTQLGPSWDGGVEVSFGQWQKIALARGFMRDDPLVVVLDEPTAALDAETEHALFERYAASAKDPTSAAEGRITILVSHRFSTVRMADVIVMLDGSRVAEVGSHEELMTNNGPYASLYNIQAAAYQ